MVKSIWKHGEAHGEEQDEAHGEEQGEAHGMVQEQVHHGEVEHLVEHMV